MHSMNRFRVCVVCAAMLLVGSPVRSGEQAPPAPPKEPAREPADDAAGEDPAAERVTVRFVHTPFIDVLERLMRETEVDFVVVPELAEHAGHVTARFTDRPVREVMEAMAAAAGVGVMRTDGGVFVFFLHPNRELTLVDLEQRLAEARGHEPPEEEEPFPEENMPPFAAADVLGRTRAMRERMERELRELDEAGDADGPEAAEREARMEGLRERIEMLEDREKRMRRVLERHGDFRDRRAPRRRDDRRGPPRVREDDAPPQGEAQAEEELVF